MIRVLIVEDEPPIARELKSLVEAADSDFAVTNQAFNGQKAIDLLKSETFDVVFTDISMPIIDGFGLLKYISQNIPNTICVILTGFSEFSYAKKAISLGVIDYLLKPINNGDLIELLARIKENISRKMIEKASIGAPLSNISAGAGTYAMALCQAESVNPYDADASIYNIPEPEEIEKKASQFLDPQKGGLAWAVKGKSYNETILILMIEKNTAQHEIMDIFKKIYLNFSQGPHNITMAVAHPFEHMSQIHDLIRVLRDRTQNATVIGASNFILPDDVFVLPKQDKSIEESIIKLVNYRNAPAAKELLKKLCEYFKHDNIPQIIAERTILRLITSIEGRTLLEEDNLEIEREIREASAVSASYDDFFNNIVYMFDEILMQQEKGANETAMRGVVLMQIDEFIENNFSENISTKMLSEKFGFVPSYLSKIYRRHKGMSPVEYVTFLRIEYAKKLIQNSDSLTIREVSNLVGYEDSLYFSKLFKKTTGVSPSEYKKKLDV